MFQQLFNRDLVKPPVGGCASGWRLQSQNILQGVPSVPKLELPLLD